RPGFLSTMFVTNPPIGEPSCHAPIAAELNLIAVPAATQHAGAADVGVRSGHGTRRRASRWTAGPSHRMHGDRMHGDRMHVERMHVERMHADRIPHPERY
ncbi:MAG TPA: hypothetical protein VFA63_11580, partial [Pseudonocardiaceae bacterium]|nr:hypothetical protein [Pseudonocardiaceae bacterium]